ncbi:hypothetical protein Cgig2_013077 [Carnegiea gigantea]|uniref:Cell number regulator 6 n=1 Tax=Carnegiea gigantea TaxID=171969 RepID=A0A9Q1QP74_9CARY|nr:hypothetical protein Cgig2_013077 [Carnegiea gigantea]
MGDPSQQYVKLTREPAAVEITPGELNQPVDVPQLNPRTCHECGQALPDGYEVPSDEPWMSGICACAQDPDSCKLICPLFFGTRSPSRGLSKGMTGMLCPCVLFGRNVEKFKEEIPWTNACICHAICIEGGLTLAALMAIFNGYFEPNTLHLCGEGLLFGWWICAIYNGLFREELQKKYHLQDAPCDPCVVHCCLHWCALCQEHREMKGRLSDNAATTMTNPPPMQAMTAVNNRGSSSSSENGADNQERSGLELQPV